MANTTEEEEDLDILESEVENEETPILREDHDGDHHDSLDYQHTTTW